MSKDSERRSIRRIVTNSASLLSGNIAGALVAFLALSLTGHLLDPTDFGILVLVSSYAQIVSRLVGFQSWQALIRFGSQALTDPAQFQYVVTAGLILDGAAALGGTILFLASVPFFAAFYHLTSDMTLLAYGFGLTLLTNLAGMPIGVLRLFGRFQLLGMQEFAAALIRLFLLAASLALPVSVTSIGIIWIVSLTAGQMLLLYLGIREMRANKIRFCRTAAAADFLRSNPQIVRFFLISNLDATIRVLRDADILIVGALLSPGAAGFYRIARQLGALVSRPADAMHAALYPELVKQIQLRAKTLVISTLVRCSSYAAAIGVAACAIFVVTGQEALRVFLGAHYAPAYVICLFVLASNLIWAMGHPLAPAMLALEQQKQAVTIHLVATAIYLPAVAFLTHEFGLNGAGVAQVGFIALWTGLSTVSVWRALSQMSASAKLN